MHLQRDSPKCILKSVSVYLWQKSHQKVTMTQNITFQPVISKKFAFKVKFYPKNGMTVFAHVGATWHSEGNAQSQVTSVTLHKKTVTVNFGKPFFIQNTLATHISSIIWHKCNYQNHFWGFWHISNGWFKSYSNVTQISRRCTAFRGKCLKIKPTFFFLFAEFLMQHCAKLKL